MRLKDYLRLHKITVVEASKQLGLNRTYLHRILTEEQIPSRKLAKQIEFLKRITHLGDLFW